MLRRWITFGLVLGLCALPAQAKLAADLARPARGQKIRVIVQYKEGAIEQANPTDARGREMSLRRHLFENLPFAVVDVSAAELDALVADENVEYISPDREIRTEMATAAWSVRMQDYHGVSPAKGLGVGIAFIDSGVRASHPNFTQYMNPTTRIVYQQSSVNTSTDDEYGHGTHVASIASGMDNIAESLCQANNCRQTFWGVVPDSRIISLKALNAQGIGSDSTVIAAIDRAIALKSQYNIRVINMSLGRPVRESYRQDPLCQAAERAWRAGIVVVVSAGNEGRNNSANTKGYGTITSPGNDPYVITVGAINHKSNWDPNNDVIATYSSKGPTMIDRIVKPDIVAPGNRVFASQASGSTLVAQFPGNRPPVNMYQTNGNTGPSPHYFKLSGTSMAAPLVSGASAALIAKDPTLTPDQVKSRLMKTARRTFPSQSISSYEPSNGQTYNATHDLFTVGAGILDIWAAYNNTEKPSGTAASPSVYVDSQGKVRMNTNSTGGSNLVWGDSGFALNLVWGSNLVWGTNLVWGSNLVWGTSSMSGFNIVWGSSSPWTSGSSTPKSTAINIDGEN